MTTNELHNEERTDRELKDPSFNLLRDEQGRLYLRIFTEENAMHLMLEIDYDDVARLQERLTKPPRPVSEK